MGTNSINTTTEINNTIESKDSLIQGVAKGARNTRLALMATLSFTAATAQTTLPETQPTTLAHTEVTTDPVTVETILAKHNIVDIKLSEDKIQLEGALAEIVAILDKTTGEARNPYLIAKGKIMSRLRTLETLEKTRQEQEKTKQVKEVLGTYTNKQE